MGFNPTNPDFKPELKGYKKYGAFRFWCQQVLPLTFDDSLSYYELLNKLVDYLNKTMDNVNTLGGDVESLGDAYNELEDNVVENYNNIKNYLDTYFDNLDVQDEINDKLDEMASDGSLSTLLAPIIPELVTDWLQRNVTPVGSAVVVDSSLTISGAAADAKITGNIRDSLQTNLHELNLFNLLDYVIRNNVNTHGVNWSWNGETLIAKGTATAISNYSMFMDTETLPKGFIPGNKYSVRHNSDNVITKIYDYSNGNVQELFNSNNSGEFEIPENCSGFIIRFTVNNGVTVDEEFIPIITEQNTKSNKELTEYYNKYMPLKGNVGQGIDCDSITDYGIHFVPSNNNSANWCFSYLAGWLFVLPSNENNVYTMQVGARFIPKEDENWLYRVKTLDGWTEWAVLHETFYLNNVINSMLKYNAIDLMPWSNGTTGNNNGITYTKISNYEWNINGESTALSFRNIFQYNNELPPCFVPGRKYKSIISSNSTAIIQVYFFYPDNSYTHLDLLHTDTFEIPLNAKGIVLRFKADNNTIIENETVSVSLVSVPVWQGLQTIVNQNINNNNYENTYNITVDPQITTDSNGWLQPVDTESEDETNKTDMTSAIMAMLTQTGYCHLAPGIYYVSGNIDMPAGSCIEGCGYETDVRLLSNVDSGYIFKLEKYNTVKNLKLSGSFNNLPYNDFTHNKGNRNGILFNSNYTNNSESEYCTIDNVFILNFNGCGIKCYNTSIATHRGIYCSKVDIKRCQTGLYVDSYSEFNKFEMVNTRYCYQGCENNGGNNVFIGCTFHATTTSFLIDNSLDDKPNNAHGSVVGCTFCHTGNNSGEAIKVLNTTNGFVFSDCQFWYNSINVKDSFGIVFNSCEIGRNVPITIEGGGTIMFSNCMFMNDINYPPNISVDDNNKVKLVNCYGSHSGSLITLN